jgi:hypothetical protein
LIGSQKIMRNLDEAVRRIEQKVFPYEEAIVGKLLIIRREWVDGRTTVILIREPVGV